MTFLLLALSFASAQAVVPVRLPAQERASEWVEALSLAGLGIGTPGEGPYVEIVAGATQWVVRVRDRAGAIHEAPVPAPRTHQEREDLAMLAASLLQPMAVATPVKPPPPAPPPQPRPKVVVVEPPPAPPPAPEPPPPPPPEPPPPEPPAPEPPPPPALSVRLGGAGEVRPFTAPTGVVWAELQLIGSGPVRPSVGVAWTPPTRLPTVSSDVRFWAGEAWLGAWYAAEAPLRFDVGIAGGVALRPFLQEGEPKGMVTVPIVATRVEAPVRIAPWLVVEPGVHLLVDLVEIDVASRSEGAVRFGDWSVRASIGLRPTLPRSARPAPTADTTTSEKPPEP